MKYLGSLIVCLCLPLLVLAQDPINAQIEDDLGVVEDRFQELFFEALKQKGIENYDRAIEALQECLKINPDLPELYFELGKNYKLLKQFPEAEKALNKALELKPKDEWILDELYDVYFQQSDTENAMRIVKELVDIHPDYKQDLATLYLKQGDFKSALELLDELDKQFGPNEVRNDMRNEIYNATGNDAGRIENLIQRIAANPKIEDNYLKLIYRYSEQGNEQKAYKVAMQLITEIPESELAHLALYKFSLNQGKPDEAVSSIKIILNSSKVDSNTKTKVLNDFVNFVKTNPNYEDELLELTSSISGDSKSKLELGYYYLQNGDKAKALENLSEALLQNPSDYDLIKNVLLLRVDFEQYEAAAQESAYALELFPAQPLLYLLNGVANNRISKPDEAIESLEMGVDYIIDDAEMQIDFYNELSLAYKQKNNIKKSESFAKKANELKQQQE
ncbi:MAG: tetratricopeptide repeat protein [Bacteroidota bacterium]